VTRVPKGTYICQKETYTHKKRQSVRRQRAHTFTPFSSKRTSLCNTPFSSKRTSLCNACLFFLIPASIFDILPLFDTLPLFDIFLSFQYITSFWTPCVVSQHYLLYGTLLLVFLTREYMAFLSVYMACLVFWSAYRAL